jgi:hypothetical protein
MHLTRRKVPWAVAGGTVGVLLSLLAFLCSGAGHGTSLPLVLSTSPLTLLPFVGFLFGAPVLWGAIAVLATAPPTRRNKLLFAGVMLSHYVVAAALLCWTPCGDRDMIARTQEAVPGFFEGWFLAYSMVNFFAWWLFFGGGRTAGRNWPRSPERIGHDDRREPIETGRERIDAPEPGPVPGPVTGEVKQG